MLLGTSKTFITPPIGTPLAGFGFRDRGSDAILDDLELRIMWLQDEFDPSRAACVVCADIIGFDAALSNDIKSSLATRHGISHASILLCASHTHSGPQTCQQMIGVGQYIPEVVAGIRSEVLAGVISARSALEHVNIDLARGHCEGYSINRRKVIDGRATSGPNPDGIRDDEVTSIVFSDCASSAIRAVLFHFTCHPTTIGSYSISADYPGVARRYIERALGGNSVAAFLPGCCGDVRPNCTFIGGQQFRRGQPEDVAAFGLALGESVLRSVTAEPVRRQPTRIAALYGTEISVDLPYQQLPSRDELKRIAESATGVSQVWAISLLKSPLSDRNQVTMQRLDLTEDVTLLALGGEACCGYGRYIKQISAARTIIPIGYANGIVGYLPTLDMFSEGGYEVQDSTVYFGLPSTFSPAIVANIQAGIHVLMSHHT